MNEIKAVDMATLNQFILEHINSILYSFCFGKYKEEKTYPETLTRVQLETPVGKEDVDFITRLSKNAKGVLNNIRIIIIRKVNRK